MYKSLNRDTQIILKIVITVLSLWVLWLLRDLVLILLLALVLASAMEPMVDYFKLKRVPRSLSVLAVYVVVLGFFGLMIALITPIIIDQFSAISSNLPNYTNELLTKFPWLNYFFHNLDLTSILKELSQFGSGESSLFSRTLGVFSGILAFVSTLVIAFYLSVEEDGLKKFIKTLVPNTQQEFTYNLVSKIQKRLGRWVLGQFILAFSIFVLTWVGLSILGIQNALFLALIAGALEIVPYMGPILSAIPAMLIAFTQSPVLGLGVLVLYGVIQKTEGLILVPKVMQKTIGVSPIVILLALLAGFKLAGVAGLLLAVPLVGIFTVIIEEWPQSNKS